MNTGLFYNSFLKEFSSFAPTSKFILFFGAILGLLLILGTIYCFLKILASKFTDKERTDERQILLDKIEKNSSKALQKYIKVGYFEADKKMLKSRRWWKKLDGLLALDIIQPRQPQKELLPEIKKLIKHNHPLVRVMAAKITFNFLEDAEAIDFLDHLNDDQFFQEDLFYDAVLESYFAKEQIILEYLYAKPNTHISRIILRAIAELRAEHAQAIIIKLVKENRVEKYRNLSSILAAIARLKILELEDEVVKLTGHPQNSVKRNAFFCLRKLNGRKYNANFFIDLLEQQKEPEMQDILSYLGRPQ